MYSTCRLMDTTSHVYMCTHVQVGPILGPLVGGALSDAFGWRSTMVALAIFAAVALVGKLWVLREVSTR
jgi:MFS family permease